MNLGQGLLHLGFKQGIINEGQNRARFNRRAIIDRLAVRTDSKLSDHARDLRADVNDILRFQGAGGAEGHEQIRTFGFLSPEAGDAGVRWSAEPENQAADAGTEQLAGDDVAFHGAPIRKWAKGLIQKVHQQMIHLTHPQARR